MTQRLKPLADHWRWMVAPSEQALEQVIHEDAIDILVELSGHTEGHQLGMLARRVAPLQVTYLGYPNTSGLAAIDYRIPDARADPPGIADSLHVEKLLRLRKAFVLRTARQRDCHWRCSLTPQRVHHVWLVQQLCQTQSHSRRVVG
jgi:predicted O-linked N-acetylglucosamine transferase (SPINDLY family)